MWESVRTQLGRDAEGVPVVAVAYLAAAGRDQLDASPETDGRAEGGGRPLAVQRKELFWRRDGRTGCQVQGRRLLAPDSRHFFPALLPPRRPDGMIGGGEVEVA